MEKCCLMCKYGVEMLMIEYINSFKEIGLEYDKNDTFKDKQKINIMSGPIINGIKTFLNTEQLTIEKIKNSLINDFKNSEIKKLFLFDYSYSNFEILNSLPDYRANISKVKLYYLPYQYSNEEVNRLRNLYENTPKTYQVGVISVKNLRRHKICQMLKRARIKLNVINLFGEERDKEMAKCQLLLNIHHSEDYKIFEEIRCMRWWYAGVPIISESCFRMEHLDVFPYIIWVPYHLLFKTVISIVSNPILLNRSKPNKDIINMIANKRKETAIKTINDYIRDYN
jgi:hypothetical protein